MGSNPLVRVAPTQEVSRVEWERLGTDNGADSPSFTFCSRDAQRRDERLVLPVEHTTSHRTIRQHTNNIQRDAEAEALLAVAGECDTAAAAVATPAPAMGADGAVELAVAVAVAVGG